MSTHTSHRICLAAGTTLVATLLATAAFPAAIERAIPSTTRLLFEEGRYLEFGVSYIDPDQSGDNATIPTNLSGAPIPLSFEGSTGDLFDGHWNFGAAYKADINDRLSYALIFDQPYGADTSYGGNVMTGIGPATGQVFSYDGTEADLDTYHIAGVLAYDVTDQWKVYGGLRAQRLSATASIPFVSGYDIDADADWGYGYLVGAAYSRPEIALRVALTYHSAIDHDLDTAEFTEALGPQNTKTDITTPQAVTLEAQTGVAANTLVFGSIRWVDWSEFEIAPPEYVTVTGGRPLVDYSEDWWTYNLGVGYQFREDLAGSFSVTYEPDVGGELTTLGPYDGRTTLNLGGAYDINDNLNISGGLIYGWLGDTYNVLDTDFNDGSVWGAGLRVGYTF